MIWNADNQDGTYTNPILYQDFSDPDAIRVGEDYFMVASSFSNSPGLPLLHSTDLVNWQLVDYVITDIPEKRYNNPVHGCGVWAPSIRYHEGVFYVCFPMPDEGIYMCTATDPYGNWSKPVNIRPGAGWIDPCPFWDDDGKAYLVAGVAKSRIGYKSVLHIVEMAADGLSLIGPEIKVFDGNENDQETIEGPKLYKKNGYYYIFAPAGGVKTGWQTVLRSKNIYGPYEYRMVMRQGSTNINGPHQGAWVDTVTGQDWFIHFQDVYAAGRITHLQPMSWEDDWPVIGKKVSDFSDYPYGEPVLTHKKPDVGNGVGTYLSEPETSDDFSQNKLGLQWQWNANLKEEWYELTDNSLRLKAVCFDKNLPYGDEPNLLLQKWPAPEFKCTYHIDLSHLEAGDRAGMISMGMKYGLLEFAKDENEIKVSFIQGQQFFEGSLVSKTIEDKRIIETLPVNTSKLTVEYSVIQTGRRDLNEKEKDFPKEEVIISYVVGDGAKKEAGRMIAEPGRWVGTKNGLFARSIAPASKGYLLVNEVCYNR